MLDFLVTSKARRRLLQLLWGEGLEGTVSDLAKRAGVGFASAWRELKAMQSLGMVASEPQGASTVFRANPSHPHADLLRALVARPRSTPDDDARRLRAELHGLGAPLQSDETLPPDGEMEETVVRAVQLARKDPSVARALPVCLYRQRDRLHADRLLAYARTGDEKHALGFFLDLTSALSSEPRFHKWTTGLRDKRRRAKREFFFTAPRTRQQEAVSRERAPAVALRWGFVMNMDLETFRSAFEKHAYVH